MCGWLLVIAITGSFMMVVGWWSRVGLFVLVVIAYAGMAVSQYRHLEARKRALKRDRPAA